MIPKPEYTEKITENKTIKYSYCEKDFSFYIFVRTQQCFNTYTYISQSLKYKKKIVF